MTATSRSSIPNREITYGVTRIDSDTILKGSRVDNVTTFSLSPKATEKTTQKYLGDQVSDSALNLDEAKAAIGEVMNKEPEAPYRVEVRISVMYGPPEQPFSREETE